MRLTTCRTCKHEFQKEDTDSTYNVVCPVCGIKFCNKSPTEKSLFENQELYINKIVNKDKFIHSIYETMFTYTRSLIMQNFRNRLQDASELDDYTCQAIHYFFIYYIEDDDFIVMDSFSGLVFHKIRQAINEKSNHASAEYSLNYTLDDNSEIQYEETVCDYSKEIEEYEEKLSLLKHITQFIFQLEFLCNNRRENFIRLMAFHHYLKFGEKKADNLFKQYGRFGKIKYEDTLEFLHKELLKLHKENI